MPPAPARTTTEPPLWRPPGRCASRAAWANSDWCPARPTRRRAMPTHTSASVCCSVPSTSRLATGARGRAFSRPVPATCFVMRPGGYLSLQNAAPAAWAVLFCMHSLQRPAPAGSVTAPAATAAAAPPPPPPQPAQLLPRQQRRHLRQTGLGEADAVGADGLPARRKWARVCCQQSSDAALWGGVANGARARVVQTAGTPRTGTASYRVRLFLKAFILIA
jgi:hypothetical protein